MIIMQTAPVDLPYHDECDLEKVSSADYSIFSDYIESAQHDLHVINLIYWFIISKTKIK